MIGRHPAPAARSRVGNPITVRVIRDLEGLNGLKEAWKALSEFVRSPMQTFAWVSACAAAFAAPGELHITVVADREGPIAIAPLVRRRGTRRGAPVRLRLLGADELLEPMDFVWANEAALETLAEALVRSGLPLWLQRVPADSPTLAALERAYGRRHRQPASPYTRILLNSGWTDPASHLTSSRRSLLRRMKRRAEGIGTVSFEVLTPALASLQPLLDEAFRVEAASWKGREGTALENDRVRGQFFRSYGTSACEEGTLRLCFLRIDGQPAAMLYAVEHRGGFWLLKMGYDDRFASCSPGSLLLEHTMKHSAARGLATYEFLGEVEECTRAWTHNEYACVELRTYPLGFNGAVAFCSDAARFASLERRRAVQRWFDQPQILF